jgi:hypothetical protein
MIDRLTGRRALLAVVAERSRGTALVGAAIEDVPGIIQSVVARIQRASITALDDLSAVLTQRSEVLMPRTEARTLGFHRGEGGRTTVAIVHARRGGLTASDSVPSQFEVALLASIRTAAEDEAR